MIGLRKRESDAIELTWVAVTNQYLDLHTHGGAPGQGPQNAAANGAQLACRGGERLDVVPEVD
eukprot:5302797-Prorocentrum_lima.AAC.1